MKKIAGSLGYTGDFSTHLYRDYNKPCLNIPIKQPVYPPEV